MIKRLLILALLLSLYQVGKAQNPIIPGYFADPSIKKFGDTYYLYVTTDGYPPYGNEGQTFVWTSLNLTDWKPEVLEGLPNKMIWAPAIVKGKNNKFYLYTTNAVDYSGYVWEGDSPTGPFSLKNHIGGFDLEPFTDPLSGKIYVVSASKLLMEMDNNVKSQTYLTKVIRSIPLKGSFYDFTEGPYMVYKNGWYYLMWSGGNCSDISYNVRYAYSKNIDGPYIDGKEPIIKTDVTRDIMGPGHNSVIDINGRSFLVYHREDSSRPLTCNYRFTCISEIAFSPNGEVKLLAPIDDIGKLLGLQHQYTDLALNKDVIFNSSVNKYDAKNAVDGRNDTRWTSKAVPSFLAVDLGNVENAEGVEIDFEYLDKYQTFKVEYSTDNIDWKILDDHSTEAILAYKARLILKPFSARYVRLSFSNSEDHSGSVWEFKVLGKT